MCSSWLFTRSSIQIQAWPAHQIRPNRGVGLRGWIQDDPGDDLHAGSITEEEQPSSHSSSSRSQTRHWAVALEADCRLHTSRFFLAFPGLALLERPRGYVIGPSLESAAALHQWAANTSRRPTLSERWAGMVRRGKEEEENHLSAHHCMNNGQPATSPDTHVMRDQMKTLGFLFILCVCVCVCACGPIEVELYFFFVSL